MKKFWLGVGATVTIVAVWHWYGEEILRAIFSRNDRWQEEQERRQQIVE